MAYISRLPRQNVSGFLLMLLCCLGLNACRTTPAPKPVQLKAQVNKPLEGKDVTFTVTEDGKKRWVLHAASAVYSPDQKLADLKTVHGDVYDTEEKKVATFESPTGKYEQVEKWITLSDGVTATSADTKDGTVLKAPTVNWKTGSNEALAKGGVTIVRNSFGTSTADHCTFTLDFTKIALTGNASTRVK